MSGEKVTSPCNKFQANIFNKSKCQNCFKSRELHLLNDHDMEQAKPIYGGWLCLAPEGTDFDNPMQRSRKWQRRFFILYEHGSLSFALDELPSTLPQGTVNLNLCTDITDAEPRTGQRNALCIVTTEQEIFIRGDNKEIINGWSEQLAVYLRTNKQNQKKKRKVEPVATQEPSPAKMAATDPSFPHSDSRWQEDQLGMGPDVTSMWSVTDPLCPDQTPAVDDLAAHGNGDPVTNKQLAESNIIQTSSSNKDQSGDRSTAQRILGLEAAKKEQGGERKGRSEARTNTREKLQSCGDITQLSVPAPQRRAKSLDGRTTDTVMIPDLLNFKKGWMVKLDKNDQWKKYWFVLSTDSLRYYKDSAAEEASELEGEINLTKCYNVSEYQVQRNYGFQIHTPKAVYTLSAMTAGIRRNWIQALMKNVHPATAPDITSLPGHHVPCSPTEALPKPDVTQDFPSADIPTERGPHPKPRSVTERRREGRYRTFDWAEFRPQNKLTLETDPRKTKSPCSLELGDLERRKRRGERRRRYESMLGFSLSWEAIVEKTVDGSVRPLSPKSQKKVEEEIEECWKQVEKTVFRLERTVPLFSEATDPVETEGLLDKYRKWAEDLQTKLAESEHRRLEVEAQLSTTGCHQQQLDHSLFIEADLCSDINDTPLSNSAQSPKGLYEETRELLQQQNIMKPDMQEQHSLSSPSLAPQTPSIWLQDTEGNFQELIDLLPGSVATPSLSPASDNQDVLSQSDGQTVELNLEAATSTHKNPLDRENTLICLTLETQKNNTECGSGFLIPEMSADGDCNSLDCCVEQHLPPDQAVVRRLSQEVELLTSQNEALNQRNQEMLNQLAEADREIERLKSELCSRYSESSHLLEMQQQEKVRMEDLKRELNLRNQELQEAQALISSLKETQREAEALLQLNITAESRETEELKSKCDTKSEGYLLRYFEATEAKLTELERQLNQSELTCRKLLAHNLELKEAEKRSCKRAVEVDTDTMWLNDEFEEERMKDTNERKCISGEERIKQVIEVMVMRLEALVKLLEVIDKLDLGKECEYEEEKPTVVEQLKWEEDFWSTLRNELQASPSKSNEKKPVEILLSQLTEHVILEKQVQLLGHDLLCDTDEEDTGEALKDLDIIWNNAGVTETEIKKADESRMFEFSYQMCDIEHFRAFTQMKVSLLNHMTSIVGISAPEKLQLVADRLYNFHFSEHPWSGFIHSAATEALYCCRLSRLQSKHEQECEEIKHKLITTCLSCNNCIKLIEENRELRTMLQLRSDKRSTCCQTDETYSPDRDTELKMEKGCSADEIEEKNIQQTPETPVDCVEILLSFVEGQLEIQILDENTEKCDDSHKETVPSEEMDQVSVLKRRVEELEELLSVITEEMKDDFDGQMSSVQRQHEKEMEKLKATCERGFASMQESHLKVLEELQRRHQQEVERLLVERDQLLEEESAATATAIEAIKNAHRLELEREMERRCQSESWSGNTHLEHVYRQHSEELASYQRELEVLSQQFSMKCLENGHLVQALDAERKALCQCQLENQDLRTRNQELSGHLAAEITRLCSLAKQDNLPLTQGMDIYEMEITLRVKESEVQCLKQEITSLKDEVLSAQRDRRNASKKYKDMYTELSIVRAKAEREMDELRENLRLAHQALGKTSP